MNLNIGDLGMVDKSYFYGEFLSERIDRSEDFEEEKDKRFDIE